MTPRALLDACSGLLGEVLRFDAPADNAVSAFFRQHRVLGARERHTLAETVYEVLRRRLLYQHLAQGAPKDGARPERRLAMLGWAGDAAFLKAALSEAEQGWLAQARAVDRTTLAPRLRHNLPDWIAQPLEAQLGEAGFWVLVEALDRSAPSHWPRIEVLPHAVEEYGHERIVRFRYDDPSNGGTESDVGALLNGRDVIAVGERLRLGVDTAHLHFFDTQSGNALA